MQAAPDDNCQHIQIKVCGLTDPAQAGSCAQMGADAIGLVFYPPSPRHVNIEQARKIVDSLPPTATPVGVFVDEDYGSIMRRVDHCGLKAVQLHGKEPYALVQRLTAKGLLVIKTLFVTKNPHIDQARIYADTTLLVESGLGRLPGGNAQTWDWSRVRQLSEHRIVVLAGGLSTDNIIAAIHGSRAQVVDVSSGVESKPGHKDLLKVKSFIDKVIKCQIDYSVPPIFGINAQWMTQSSSP